MLVTETQYHTRAMGATKDEALDNFWRVFYEEGDDLARDEEQLSDRLKAQLQYIREIKEWEDRLRKAKQEEEKRHERAV